MIHNAIQSSTQKVLQTKLGIRRLRTHTPLRCASRFRYEAFLYDMLAHAQSTLDFE